MLVPTAFLLLVTSELCLTIRVPSSWDHSASEVKQDNDEQFSVETLQQSVNEKKPIPVEYFEYTAKKPQFAVDVANFHGVQSPENHYKAYPIKPHTGKIRPELGKHHILNNDNKLHRPLQEFTNINEDPVSHAVPVSSNYEVFHPYEAETPALQEIYKDPVLNKIRNDLENSKNRLQAYEKDAGEPNISSDEYLESPQKTDSKFGPQRNRPAPYEIHRPQRRPIYYRPARKPYYREQQLNQKLKHPWNQYSARIRPVQYKPLKNHIHQLRQNHALKYDDERNEYPQVQILENYSDPKDGYDIYEKGKDKFVQLRNNVDESINKAVKENGPATYEKLEVQSNDDSGDDDEEEFVPIKNYAQVRKTESYKHLPRSAAFADADTFDEIRNAPRLREAVKSTKAQTVYSEEGYEDTAYDHAGEQKHASENEGHGGLLKQHELSGGKYKTPSESAKFQDGRGSAYRDEIIHAEKWKDDNRNNKEEIDEEDYSEDEHEKSIEAEGYNNSSDEDSIPRSKREYDDKNDTDTSDSIQMQNESTTNYSDYSHRANFKIPELDFNSTYLTEKDILKLAQIRIEPKKDTVKQKYPYYYEKIRAISEHSPLRYAESLKSIPRKSKGGTEFYDSRSKFECPEVDDAPDPIPEKLKGEGHPDDNDDDEENNPSKKDDENFETAKKTPRLKGLGDKIDCFKAKYFGENPLDSPFFIEEIIPNPEPITPPSKLGLHHFKPVIRNIEPNTVESKLVIIEKENSNGKKPDIFKLIEKLRRENPKLQENNETRSDDVNQQSRVYSDVLENIQRDLNGQVIVQKNNNFTNIVSYFTNPNNVTYLSYKNKEDVTKSPHVLRRKRSTPFVYEPYKIIRDSQLQDSKKTTTTNNISPLIRKLQSSRVADRVTYQDKESEKHKRNVMTRTYKDIGRKEREGGKNDKVTVDPSFVDVSVDKRRGEPRYEIRLQNHKPTYTPVENKKSMSVEDYKSLTTADRSQTKDELNTRGQLRQKTSTEMSLSKPEQHIADSSNTIHKTISTTLKPPQHTTIQKESDSDEDYEYEDDDEEEEEITTTTTPKPIFRRKMRTTTTTEQIPESTERPKLKLVTRFRDHKLEDSSEDSTQKIKTSRKFDKEHIEDNITESTPKYREKKKKSSKSTLVTDTKRYGDDDADMRKEEIDALIGVKQDMDDYMPLYEKEEKETIYKHRNKENNKSHTKQNDEDESDDDDDDDDDSDIVDDDEDNDDSDTDEEEIDDDESDDTDDDDENEDDEEEEQPKVTTPEPTKRTLVITTEAPTPTIATKNAKLESKPIVTKKKIEIHKELPSDKSSPHVSQYKQDIKEVEIIKEIPTVPKKKTQKNLEALELYKDDNLAKDINLLGGVEIFKENLDLKNGPKHGGNYRSLEEPEKSISHREKPKEDAVASQSEFTKHEIDGDVRRNRMHGGNLRSISDVRKSQSRGRSEKLIELSDRPSSAMHGGNLKKGRNPGKSQKLIELDDSHETHEDDDDSSSDSHESFNTRKSIPMHGGNYRSAKIVAEDKQNPKVTEIPNRSRNNPRSNSAAILNSFVQAVPILTTTPAYILDPSKRMYYYVDA